MFFRVNRLPVMFMVIILLAATGLTIAGCRQAVANDAESDSTLPTDRIVDGETAVDPQDQPITVRQDELTEPKTLPEPEQIEPEPAKIDEPVSLQTDELKRETRAIWSWVGARPMPERDDITKLDVEELLAKVDAAHLNVILLSVYYNGTAYFEPSHTRFPNMLERLPNHSEFSEEGYPDALSYLLAIRDQRRRDDDPTNDFEVQAWFNVAQGGNYVQDEGFPRPDKTQSYMLHHIFPEFKRKYGEYYLKEDESYIDHKYVDIHQPRFRAYVANLIAGLVEDYDVDGVHLDYIRAVGICYNNEPLDYPGTEYDYPGCQADYEGWTQATYGQAYTLWDDTNGYGDIKDGGSGRVAAWQEQAMSSLVKTIHDEVKAARPEVVITAAVGTTPPDPEQRKMSDQGQAAWEWLDKGWLDAAFVMAYYPDTQAVVDKVGRFMAATKKEDSRLKVFPGLATHDTRDEETYQRWSDLIVEQIDATLVEQPAGPALETPARGLALFLDRRLSEEAVQALANGPFKEPTVPFWGE